MRKLITMTAALALTLAMATTAFAAGNGSNSRCLASGTSNAGYCTFVDANGDDICDNAGIHCTFTDKNGDGICDNCQNKNAHSGRRCANGNSVAATGGHSTRRHGGNHH